MSGSGPATTALLWLLFSFLRDQSTPGTDLHFVWLNLAWLNGLMAVLNLLPGFPLDGGRMLMAAAWGVTHKRALAMRIAGVGSLLVGGALILWAVYLFQSGDPGGIFAGYIGFVMISVGRQIPPRAAIRERLERGTARDAMRPSRDPIPAYATLYEATEQWLRARPKYAYPVAEHGRLVGTISLDEASNRSAATRVADAMIPLVDPPIINETEPLDELVEWVGNQDGLVVDVTGRTVGLIAIEDVDRWLKAHWSTGAFVDTPVDATPPRPDL